MKNKVNPRKTLCIICIVIAALCLLFAFCVLFQLEKSLDDAHARLSKAEALVESYKQDLANTQEALTSLQANNASLQADNASLQRSVDELQVTNNDLSETLSVYEYDFSFKDPVPPRYLGIPVDKDLQDYVWSLCCAYDIEEHYELIYAMMFRESSFNSNLISATNDYGIMQINKSNHYYLSKLLGITDFLDPYQNTHAGIYMIASLLHKYGNVNDALMAYNMGDAGAAKLWSRGVHTTPYVERVLATYEQYTENI